MDAREGDLGLNAVAVARLPFFRAGSFLPAVLSCYPSGYT